MKKIIILFLLVSTTTQVYAQPPLHVVSGDGKVTLKGSRGGVTNPTHIDVYRGTTNPPENLYRTFPMNTDNYTWEDTQVRNGALYYYRVKVRDENSGIESLFSYVDAATPVTGSGAHALFDGVDDRITRSGNFLPDIFRIQFQVRIDETPSGKNMEILRIRNIKPSPSPNNNSIRIFHTQSALVLELTKDDWQQPNPRTFTVTSFNIADGEWHTIAINGLGNAWTRAFIDGNPYGFENSTSWRIRFENNQEFVLGGQSNSNTVHFKGAVDNLKTWRWNANNLMHDWRFEEPAAVLQVYDNGSSNINLTKENGVLAGSTSPFGPIAAIAYPDSVSVRWVGDIDVAGDPVQSYEVWRKAGDESLQFLTTVSKNDTSYTDKSVTTGEVYEYEVRSIKNSITLSEIDKVKPVLGFDRHLVADGSGEVQFSDDGLFADNDGTIEFRMKVASDDITATNAHSILNKHDQGGSRNGFNFLLSSSGLRVEIKDGDGNVQRINALDTTDVVDDQWHRIALTYKWGGFSTLYVDGIPQGTIENTAQVNLSNEPLRVADSPDNFWDPFVGRIDEVRVWDELLSLRTISNFTKRRVEADTTGLRGVWRFDVPLTDGIVYDDGLNSFDGTVTGNLTLSDPEVGTVYAFYDDGKVTINWDFQLNTPATNFSIYRRQIGSADDPPQNSFRVGETGNGNLSGSLVDNRPVMGAEYEYRVEAVSGAQLLLIATDQVVINDDLGGLLFLPNGQSGFVEIDENITNNQTGTIEFRFNSSQTIPAGEAVSLLGRHSASGSNNGYHFIHTSSNLSVQIKQGGVSTNLSGTENLMDGEWHHVALVYDWNGENQLYIDGAPVATASVSNIIIADEPLRIGKSLDSFWSPYNGQIDELRLWDRQLRDADIFAGKNMRLSGSTTNLAAVWHFDEQRGFVIAHDEGANNFDGLLRDGAFFFQDPGSLTFSSGTNGFNETAGNGGRIEGEMVITVEGNFFRVPQNFGRVVDQALFDIPRQISATLPNGQPFRGPLIAGLTPSLSVSEDGRSATLRFGGQAVIHAAEFSTVDLGIVFDPDIFLTDNAVAGANGDNTTVPYTLRDNTVPSLIRPIDDIELFVNDTQGAVIEASTHFSDPDFDQEFSLSVIEQSPLISTEVVGSIVLVNVDSRDLGVAELVIRFEDNDGGSVSDTLNVTISKLPQTITFDPVGMGRLLSLQEDNPITLDAVATSELPVSFALIEGQGLGFINGNVLTFDQAGVFTVAALQPGNDTYAPADSVFQTFAVIDETKQDQTITFNDDLSDLIYGDQDFVLNATSTSELPVTYTTTGLISVEDNVLSILGAGAASVTATQNGDDDFNPAAPVTINFTVGKAGLTVQPNDQSITYGEALPALDGTISGLVGMDMITVNYITEADGSSIGVFDITATFDDPGNRLANYELTNNVGTLTIQKAFIQVTVNDKTMVFGEALPTFDGTVTGIVNNDNITTTYSTVATPSSDAGTYTITALFDDPDNRLSNYSVNVRGGTLTINKADQTIIFPTIDDIDLANSKIKTLSATTNSGLPITYSLDEGDGSVLGVTLTVNSTGNFTVTASQVGGTNYNAATPVSQNFQVIDSRKQDQTITFAALSDKSFGDAPFNLSAVASSNLTVDYSSSDMTVATISDNTVTIVGAGSTTITATQDGDATFNPATPVSQTLTVNKANQTITIDPISDKLTTDAPFDIVASTTSNLLLDYAVSGPATNNGATITLGGTSGTVTVTVSQLGDNNYNAASETTTFEVSEPTKQDQTITFNAIADQFYGDQITLGASASSDLAVTYMLSEGDGTITNSVLTIEGVGSYEVTASQVGDNDFNPAPSVTKTFNVTKATLTATADDQVINEGDNIPTLTFSYVGFKLNDGPSDMDTAPSISTTATAQSAAGTYPITLSGGEDDLYNITLVDGTLTIERVLSSVNQLIQVYPNPVSETLKIGGIAFDEASIFDLDGRKVFESSSETLEVGSLPSGIFILKLIKEGREVYSQKIKVQ